MKTILLLGYGISNKALYSFLVEEGYNVLVADQKQSEDNILALDDKLCELEFDLIVKSPGIDPRQDIIQKLSQKAEMISDLECVLRLRPHYKVMAITGTNGKTTTTSLLTHLCGGQTIPAYSAGNIGIPIADIARTNPDEIYLSLECSSFQLETNRTLKPKVAVILNLKPDHLNRYDTLDDYYNAKFNLLNAMDLDDIFLLNLDDPIILEKSKNINHVKILTYSLKKQADIMVKDNLVLFKGELLFDLDKMPLPGKHNLQNAIVAMSMAKIMGIDLKHLQQQLLSFKAVEHRLEFVRDYQGIKFYNDSKATNPDATRVALDSFNENIILLAGGYDKKTGFEEIREPLQKVKHLIVFGQTKYEIAQLKKGTIIVETLEEALKSALKLAQEKDTILLSPACASFDQFKSFEHRGEVFKELVNQL